MVNEDVHCATNVVTVKVGCMQGVFSNVEKAPWSLVISQTTIDRDVEAIVMRLRREARG